MAVAGRMALVGVLVLLLSTALVGSQVAGHRVVRAGDRTGDGTAAPATVPAPAAASFRSSRTYDEVALPVRLRIPALGLNTPLDRVGRQADGAIAVPGSPTVAAWFDEGPRPGQSGPAVVVGHVDSVRGPGVFFRLDQLKAGQAVYVDRADGSTVGFTVTTVSRVPKTEFPTDKVYSPTLNPSLQLVTCGGSFDHGRRSYRDNVIVFTVPA
jgi:LPXTG-site transpeptidase (sortase) family protein